MPPFPGSSPRTTTLFVRRTFAVNHSLTLIAIAVPVVSLLLLSIVIFLVLRWLKRRKEQSRGRYSDLRSTEQPGSGSTKRISFLTTSTDLSRRNSLKSTSMDVEDSRRSIHLPDLPQHSSLDVSITTEEKPLIAEPHPVLREDSTLLKRNRSTASEYSIQCERQLSVRYPKPESASQPTTLSVPNVSRGPSTRVANYHSSQEYSELIQEEIGVLIEQNGGLAPPIPRKSSRRDSSPSVIAEVLADGFERRQESRIGIF